jgi:hypothetical protein
MITVRKLTPHSDSIPTTHDDVDCVRPSGTHASTATADSTTATTDGKPPPTSAVTTTAKQYGTTSCRANKSGHARDTSVATPTITGAARNPYAHRIGILPQFPTRIPLAPVREDGRAIGPDVGESMVESLRPIVRPW